jgi:ATP-binding cassette subfamily B protein
VSDTFDQETDIAQNASELGESITKKTEYAKGSIINNKKKKRKIPKASSLKKQKILKALPDQHTIITEEASDQDTIIAEEASDQDTIIIDESSDQNTIITEDTSDKDTIIAEEAFDQEKIIIDESSDQNTIITEEAFDQDTIITDESSGQNTIIAEEASDQNTIITDDSSDQNTVITEEASDQDTIIAEEASDQEKIIAEEAFDQEKIIAEEASDQEKIIAEEASDQHIIITDESSDQEKIIIDESSEQHTIITEELSEQHTMITDDSSGPWEDITDKLAAVKRIIVEDASDVWEDVTEKRRVAKREIAEKVSKTEEDLAQKSEEPKTDGSHVSKQQAPAQKLEPKFKFSFLHSAASLLQSRLRRKVPPVLQLTAVECGAACLAMILSYYGRQTRVAEIRDGYGIGRDGLSALDIIKAARHYGMRGRAISIRGQIDDLRFVSFPAIVYWEFNHFMVIERWSAKYVDVIDPAVGRKRLSREEFELGFTGVVIILEPGEQFDRHAYSIRKLTLRSYAAQYIKRAPMTLLQLLISSLCLQIFGLGVPVLTKVIIDQILPLNLTSIVPLLGIVVLSLFLAQLVILVLRAFLLMYLQYRIDMSVYPSFFDHLFMLPLKFFQQRSTGDILMRVSSNNTIRDIVSTQFLSTVLDGSLVVVYLIILLWQSWLFALIVLILGMLQFVLLLGANNEYRLRSARELETIGKSQGYVAEILAGMTTVKAAGAEQRVFQRWFNLFCDQLNASLRRSYLASFLSMSITMLRIISPLLLLWLGVMQVLNGTMQLGTMIALNSLAAAFVSPLTSLASSATQLPIIRSHLERLSDVMEADVEQEIQQAQEPPQLTGRIQLQHVSFKYDANASPVLKDITIDIAQGQKIAIVGPTGSGKSTLGKLLLGLYLPTEGEILYDGIPLRTLNYQSVRSQFGVIMQDARIFSGSIWQNIAFNNPGMNMENIIKAAKLAALDDDIQQMPMGYETYVAEAGNTLSGGQRQRLAIARALANRPSILLLDEATSALDVITERVIEQNLKSLSCTQIIIAHRLSTVRDADLILVLNQGCIVERGTHAELLEMQGYYAKLIHNQLSPA